MQNEIGWKNHVGLECQHICCFPESYSFIALVVGFNQMMVIIHADIAVAIEDLPLVF